jgi:hypothetical protein
LKGRVKKKQPEKERKKHTHAQKSTQEDLSKKKSEKNP